MNQNINLILQKQHSGLTVFFTAVNVSATLLRREAA